MRPSGGEWGGAGAPIGPGDLLREDTTATGGELETGWKWRARSVCARERRERLREWERGGTGRVEWRRSLSDQVGLVLVAKAGRGAASRTRARERARRRWPVGPARFRIFLIFVVFELSHFAKLKWRLKWIPKIMEKLYSWSWEFLLSYSTKIFSGCHYSLCLINSQN